MKGPLAAAELHPRVIDGIRRHRRIDGLTDKHPRFIELRDLFGAGHRRVAGIVLDVLFDHYLTCHWTQFSAWPRTEFIAAVYAVLKEPPTPLPGPLAAVAHRWVDADWLRVYETRRGVEAVLERLRRRSRRGVDLNAALAMTEGREQLLEDGFLAIFTDVQRGVDGL